MPKIIAEYRTFFNVLFVVVGYDFNVILKNLSSR